MATTINEGEVAKVLSSRAKRNALMCRKCLKTPMVSVRNDFGVFYAYGAKLTIYCQCGEMSRGVADGMDGHMLERVLSEFDRLVKEWNKANATTIKSPTNIIGLIQ